MLIRHADVHLPEGVDYSVRLLWAFISWLVSLIGLLYLLGYECGLKAFRKLESAWRKVNGPSLACDVSAQTDTISSSPVRATPLDSPISSSGTLEKVRMNASRSRKEAATQTDNTGRLDPL